MRALGWNLSFIAGDAHGSPGTPGDHRGARQSRLRSPAPAFRPPPPRGGQSPVGLNAGSGAERRLGATLSSSGSVSASSASLSASAFMVDLVQPPRTVYRIPLCLGRRPGFPGGSKQRMSKVPGRSAVQTSGYQTSTVGDKRLGINRLEDLPWTETASTHGLRSGPNNPITIHETVDPQPDLDNPTTFPITDSVHFTCPHLQNLQNYPMSGTTTP